MEVLCPQCWKSFRVNGKGRRAKYCSVSCKEKAYRRGEHNEGCDLCNLRTLLQLTINQIEEIPAWFPLIDDALGVALNALDDARGYASHEHDGGEDLAMRVTCIWRETNEAWETSCGDLFIINDGTPAENNMNYCHKCGKVIAAVPLANEAWARDTMELCE